jgi:hypothetical protein
MAGNELFQLIVVTLLARVMGPLMAPMTQAKAFISSESSTVDSNRDKATRGRNLSPGPLIAVGNTASMRHNLHHSDTHEI